MQKIPLKQKWSLFLAVSTLLLMLAQPLWAAEEIPTSQGKQEESFFQGIKRNLDEWLGRDNSAGKAQKEVRKPTEQKPKETAAKKSDGRKAIDTFKKRMNKVSDNVSESVERDKKTLNKKLDKLNDKK